jgi:O-antigen/teichoic acid export membrane protein
MPEILSTQVKTHEAIHTRYRGLIALVDQVVVSLTTFIVFLALARLNDASEVGAFALAMSIILPVRVLQDRVISTPFLMMKGAQHQNDETLLGSILVQEAFLSGLFSIVVAIIAAFFWFLQGGSSLTIAVATLAVLGPCILWRDCLRMISFARLDTYGAFFADCIVLLTTLLGLILLVYLQCVTAGFFVAATCLGTLAGIAVWFFSERPKFRIDWNQTKRDWSESWKIGRWLVAARVLGSAGILFLPWIIKMLSDEKEAGIYATCVNLVGLSYMFSRGLNNYFRPLAINAYREKGTPDLKAQLLKSGFVLLGSLSALAVFLAFYGESLMVLLYGARYAGTGTVVGLLGVVSLVTGLSIIGDNGVTAINKPRSLFLAESINGLSTLISGFVLIYSFGLIGAATASIIGQLLGSLVLVVSILTTTKEENAPVARSL